MQGCETVFVAIVDICTEVEEMSNSYDLAFEGSSQEREIASVLLEGIIRLSFCCGVLIVLVWYRLVKALPPSGSQTRCEKPTVIDVPVVLPCETTRTYHAGELASVGNMSVIASRGIT